MSKPMTWPSASSPAAERQRTLLAWAFAASLALHALTLLAPNPWQQAAMLEREEIGAFLTARLLPPAPEAPPKPAAEPPATRLKSKVEKALKAEVRKPAPPPKPRAAEKPPERLSGEQLDDALARLSDTLLYPPQAVTEGLQGEVVLLLGLGAEGQVVTASVAASSGHALLDSAALRAASRVGHFPALAGRSILLPVRFRLL
jgi:protein TonB